MRAVPVRHDQPVELPLVAQDAVDQVQLLAAVDPVHLVVRGHQRPHAGLAHRRFERHQVHGAQRVLVDLGADGHPFVLLVVTGEMLDAARDAVALDAGDVRHGETGGEQWVLRQRLERAAGQGSAGDADRRAQEHVHAFGRRLRGQDLAQAPDQLGVPGRADGHATRERQRASPAEAVAPHTRRTVGDLERRDAQAGDRGQVPQACSGRQRAPLVEVELGDEALDGAGGLGSGVYHVSTKGRPCARTERGGADARACVTRALVSAGSMTSSISKCSATCNALPWW